MEHKIALKTLAIIAVIVLAFSAFSPLVFGAKNIAFADGEPVSVALVSPQYSKVLSGASLYGFTPMDFSTDLRMGGNAIKPTANANGTFDITINAEDYTTQLNKNNNYALCMWVYFPTPSLFNLSVTISGQNSLSEAGNMSYTITNEVLASLLAKPEDSLHVMDENTDGYGYNYLEIPFSVFTNTNATEGTNYITFDAIRLTYLTSGEQTSGELLFYNISIEESNAVSAVIRAENKQPYRLFKVASNIDFSEIFLGDTLSLPIKTTAVKYAYIGETNVLTDTTNYSISAKVVTSEEETIWEWGGNFTFNTEGNTSVEFVAKNKAENSVELFNINSFSVYDFVGMAIYQNIKTFYVGQKVAIYVNVSDKLTNFSNLNFEIEGDGAKILSTNTEEKYVIIEIVKSENFKLVATATGARKYDASMGLVAEKSFEAKAMANDKKGVTIALWIALGLVASVVIGFGIKAIVDANKYNVR